MTIYEQSVSGVWTVDSPLSETFDDDGILTIEHPHYLPQDPIQQRMLLILLVVTVFVISFALLVLPRLMKGRQRGGSS